MLCTKSMQHFFFFFLKMYNNPFQIYNVALLFLRLHEYTRDIENLQYSNQIQRKKTGEKKKVETMWILQSKM